MSISVVFVVYNQHSVAKVAIDNILQNSSKDTEIVVLDNGSGVPFSYEHSQVRVVRNESNCGVYPSIWWALHESLGDIVCIFHSDLIVVEKRWDTRVKRAFENKNLGLLGFIGSNEIDSSGGRGFGTTSNFQGNEYYESISRQSWKATGAEKHGKKSSEYSRSATIDGCAMIFRRKVLQSIPFRNDFPIHHFYDKLLSCEVMEKGYEVGVLGIACDHLGGQTANKEEGYHTIAKEWCEKHGIVALVENYDLCLYLEAEKQWKEEYIKKGFIPYKV